MCVVAGEGRPGQRKAPSRRPRFVDGFDAGSTVDSYSNGQRPMSTSAQGGYGTEHARHGEEGRRTLQVGGMT